MALTKDAQGEWSPETWQANAAFGIDLDGLDLKGKVDASYFRKETEIPRSDDNQDSTIQKYDVDTITAQGFLDVSADSIFSADAKLHLLSMEITKETEDESNQAESDTQSSTEWIPETWTAKAELDIAINGLGSGLTGDATASFFRKDTIKDEDWIGWTYVNQGLDADLVSHVDRFQTDTIYAHGTFTATSDVFQGEIVASLTLDKEASDNQDKWSPKTWSASAELALNTGALDLKAEINADFYRAGFDLYDDDTIEISAEPYSLDGENELFAADAEITLKSLALTKDAQGEWSPETWTARGAFSIGMGGGRLTGEANASFFRKGTEKKEADWKGWENLAGGINFERYEKVAADRIFADGNFAWSGNDVFSGDIDLEWMQLTKEDGNWVPETWRGSATLGLNIEGLGLTQATINAEYYRSGVDNYEADTIKITLPEENKTYRLNNQNSFFDADTEITLHDLILERDETAKKWDVKSWTASGEAEIGADTMKLEASVDVRYETEQDRDDGTYTITEAYIDLGATGIGVNGEVKAEDMLIRKNETTDQWEFQSWTAEADLNIAPSGSPITASTTAEINYAREEEREIYTVPNAQLAVEITDVAELKGDAQMQYIVDKTSSEEKKYWNYIVGDLGVTSSTININEFKFTPPRANVSMAYGEMLSPEGKVDSLLGIKGSLGFDGNNYGPLQYLSINAGNPATDLDTLKEELLEIKKQETLDIFIDEGIPKDSWQFGTVSGNIDAPLNLGFVEVGDFGVKLEGNVGGINIPYGFFKYKYDAGEISSENNGVGRELEVYANNITLEIGKIAQAIAPIAQGIDQFTRYAQQPLQALTSTVGLFNNIPNYHKLELRSEIITFIKDFPGNTRKGSSNIQVVELLDKVLYLASLKPGSTYKFEAMTPVVNTAMEFINKIQTMAQAASSAKSKITLPSVSYSIDIDNKNNGDFNDQAQNPELNEQQLESYGLPTMKPDVGETMPAPNQNGAYTNLSFPFLNDIGSLLKKIFLSPDEKITVAEIDLGLRAQGKASSGNIPVGGIFSVGLEAEAGLDMSTAIESSFKMNDIYAIVGSEDSGEMVRNFGETLLKGMSMNLDKTKLNIKANAGIEAGINLISESCWNTPTIYWPRICAPWPWQNSCVGGGVAVSSKSLCTPGLGASIQLGVEGEMNVSPQLDTTDQSISLYEMLNTISGQSLFRPGYSPRIVATDNSYPNKNISNGKSKQGTMTGDIISRITDYSAVVTTNIKGLKGEIDPHQKEPSYIQININLKQPIYFNPDDSSVSLLPRNQENSIKISNTGWISARQSILSVVKLATQKRWKQHDYEYEQHFDFTDTFYLKQFFANFESTIVRKLNEGTYSVIGESPEQTIKNVEANINTISNKLLAIGSPGEIEVAFSPKDSDYLKTGKQAFDTSDLPKVFSNGTKSKFIENTKSTDLRLEDFILFSENYEEQFDSKPTISFGFTPIATTSKTNLTAKFEIISENPDILSDLMIEVVNKDFELITELGTISQLLDTTNPVEVNICTKSLEIDHLSDETSKSDLKHYATSLIIANPTDQVEPPTNAIEDANEEAQKRLEELREIETPNEEEQGQLEELTAFFQDIEELDNVNLSKIVDPNNFFSGDYGFRVRDRSLEPSKTGLAEFSIIDGAANEESVINEVAYNPSINIEEVNLTPNQPYDDIQQVMKAYWDRAEVRKYSLGSLMANVPADLGSWDDFNKAIHEKYSTIAYERKLNVTQPTDKDSKDQMASKLNENTSINLALFSNREEQLIANLGDPLISKRGASQRTEAVDLDIVMDARMDVTLKGKARYIIGETSFNIGKFNVFDKQYTFNIGKINKEMPDAFHGSSPLYRPAVSTDNDKDIHIVEPIGSYLNENYAALSTQNIYSDIDIFRKGISKTEAPNDWYAETDLLVSDNLKREYYPSRYFDKFSGVSQGGSFSIRTDRKDYFEIEGKEPLINDISTLFATIPLENNNSLISSSIASDEKLRQLINQSFEDPTLDQYFGYEFSKDDIYTKYRNGSKKRLSGLIARYQFNLVINVMQSLFGKYIKDNPSLQSNYNKLNPDKKGLIPDNQYDKIHAMEWAYNSLLGYMQILKNNSYKKVDKDVAKRLKSELGSDVENFSRVNFSSVKSLSALLVFSNALISDYVHDLPLELTDNHDQMPGDPWNNNAISSISESLADYNSKLSEVITDLASHSKSDSSLFASLAALKSTQKSVQRNLLKIYRLSNNKQNQTNEDKISMLSKSLVEAFNQNQSVELSTRTNLEGEEQIQFSKNIAYTLNEYRSVFVSFNTWDPAASYGLRLPITFDTKLSYGKSADFYIKGHPSKVPAFIDFDDAKKKIDIEIKLGANASRVEKERLTIRTEQALSAVLPSSGQNDITFMIDKDSISSLDLDLFPITNRRGSDNDVRVSSIHTMCGCDAYDESNKETLTARDVTVLGLGSDKPTGQLTKPVSQFLKLTGSSMGLGSRYYTANQKEYMELIDSDDFVLAEKAAFYASDSPGENLSPVYQYININDGYDSYWSMEVNNPIEDYQVAGIAWYSMNFDPAYQPLESGLLDGKALADDLLAITGFGTGEVNLTNYIDLRDHEQTQLQINSEDIEGVLDIDGFSNEHSLTILNLTKEKIPVIYAGDSIIVNRKNTIRFWDSGEQPANAGISISKETLASTSKGAPITYLSPSSVKVLNVNAKREVKSFSNNKDGSTVYSSNPKEVTKLYSDNLNYQYNGVAFEQPDKSDNNIEIFKYTNKQDGTIRYGTINDKETLTNDGFLKDKKVAFLASSVKTKELKAVRQFTHKETGESIFALGNTPAQVGIQDQDSWSKDGIAFYAKASSSGFDSTINSTIFESHDVLNSNHSADSRRLPKAKTDSDSLINISSHFKEETASQISELTDAFINQDTGLFSTQSLETSSESSQFDDLFPSVSAILKQETEAPFL